MHATSKPHCGLLLSLIFGLTWMSAASGANERVSVDGDGNESARGGGDPAISGDGRYVVFESSATDLIPDDTNGVQDLYVKDRMTGAIERVSLTAAKGESNQDSDNPSISADGSEIAFECYATNMTLLDSDVTADIYVYNRLLGQLEILSISNSGLKGNADSTDPAISGEGRHVAFESRATNLIAGDSNGFTDIFVYDLLNDSIERVSIKDEATEANQGSQGASISGDGRFVAFSSAASNLVDGDTNLVNDIFVFDRLNRSILRVSTSTGGGEANGNSSEPSLSSDGRFVAFVSAATDLVPGDTNGKNDIFLKDLVTGAVLECSVDDSQVQGNNYSYDPDISGDGRFVTFKSLSTNLVEGGTSAIGNIFVHDRLTRKTRRISADESGMEPTGESYFPMISGDGKTVVFQSGATNLVSGDLNLRDDVFAFGNPLFFQMISTVGRTASSSTGKTINLKSMKGRTVRGVLRITNHGNTPDSAIARGARGNGFFAVTYSSSAGNVTGLFASGGYTTPELNAEASHLVSIAVRPNKSRLQRETRNTPRSGVRWLKKTYGFSLNCSSVADSTKVDAAKIKVQHH